MAPLEQIVDRFLQEQRIGSTALCVALSGGIDSAALLAALAALAPARGISLSALHVHHGLSPNADHWARFCRELGVLLAVPVEVIRVAVDRASPAGIEGAARAARYTAFATVEAPFLALAHHLDDQAETILHQLLRGTGFKGLAGMGARRALDSRHTLLRPLLEVPRADIVEYAQAAGLAWIEDESNADTSFTRNHIRHQLLPALRERFPHAKESLLRVGRHAAEADAMLEDLARQDLAWDGAEAFAAALDRLPRPRQVNALYHWLRWQAAAPASRQQLETWAEQLFRASPPDKPHLAGGHEHAIRRLGDRLILDRKSD